jgi:hypothetical protein
LAHTPKIGGGAAVSGWGTRERGSCCWARLGLGGLAVGLERVGHSSSARSSRIVFFSFFSNLFLMPETIPEYLEIVLNARKILEKNHENSRKILRDRLRHEQSK